tara:strand:- start:414 stop:584 length:171 start_codon:yes stop_codon:yes gene_type:complete
MSEQMIKVTVEDGHTFDAFRATPAFANDVRSNFYVEDAAKLARQRSLEFLDRIHGA